MNTAKLGTLVAILLIGVGGTALAAQAFSSEDIRNPVSNEEPRCDLTVDAAATSAEAQLDKIKIEEQSIRTDVQKSGFLLSLTGTSTDEALSILTAQNVEMTFTVDGPVTRETTKDLGKLGAVGKTKGVSHTFKKLPQGEYTLDILLEWEKSQDTYSQSVDVQCGDGGN